MARLDILAGGEPTPPDRPFIGVRFVCSNRYVRVYRDVRGERYLARCPTCGRTVPFRVGSGGMSERFFEVSCG